VVRWWGGPGELTTVIDELDVRPGGKWRFVENNPEYGELAFHGFYHEVNAPERVVYTFQFEGMPEHVALETITLTEADGRTVMTDQLVFQTVEARDGMVASGMESGSTASMDRLAALVESA